MIRLAGVFNHGLIIACPQWTERLPDSGILELIRNKRGISGRSLSSGKLAVFRCAGEKCGCGFMIKRASGAGAFFCLPGERKFGGDSITRFFERLHTSRVARVAFILKIGVTEIREK